VAADFVSPVEYRKSFQVRLRPARTSFGTTRLLCAKSPLLLACHHGLAQRSACFSNPEERGKGKGEKGSRRLSAANLYFSPEITGMSAKGGWEGGGTTRLLVLRSGTSFTSSGNAIPVGVARPVGAKGTKEEEGGRPSMSFLGFSVRGGGPGGEEEREREGGEEGWRSKTDASKPFCDGQFSFNIL